MWNSRNSQYIFVLKLLKVLQYNWQYTLQREYSHSFILPATKPDLTILTYTIQAKYCNKYTLFVHVNVCT